MVHRANAHAPPLDARLATLLETEKRLEARVRGAEEDARARIAAARADAARTTSETRDALERDVRRDEEEDAARQAAELAAIERGAAAACSRAALSERDVERLAQKVYARVIGGAS